MALHCSIAKLVTERRGLVWSVVFDPTDGKRIATGCWTRPGLVKTWNLGEK